MINKLLKKDRLSGLLESDVLVSSFPKTGSTLTRFILANIVAQDDGKESAVDFHNLGKILPECRTDDLDSFQWLNKKLPRFVKTHELQSVSSFYLDKRVIYVLRDPRDTMISYYNYARKRKSNRFSGSFNEFIDDEKFGIPAYNEHVHQWFDSATWVFTYEQLMTNPQQLFRDMLGEICVEPFDESLINEAICRSSPDMMKKMEVERSRPNHEKNFDKDFQFVRNASTNQWKTELDKEISDYIWSKSSNTLKLLYTEN